MATSNPEVKFSMEVGTFDNLRESIRRDYFVLTTTLLKHDKAANTKEDPTGAAAYRKQNAAVIKTLQQQQFQVQNLARFFGMDMTEQDRIAEAAAGV